jgi:heme/copper-type cytochrome/quinol oxidase subunit 1
MFGAKLFGIAGVLIAVLAPFAAKLTAATFDFYLHDTYFVIVPRDVMWELSLLFALVAGLYYVVGLALGRRLKKPLTLAHFLLWIFSLVVLILEARGLARADQAGQNPNESWLLIAGLAAPIFAFPGGAVLFLVNLARAIVLKFKTT